MIEEKPIKKKKKQYFGPEVEEAIMEYNNTEDKELKSLIYQRRIHPAFFKLTQNLIHSFKFYHTEVDNLEDLQHEVIIFLLSKIHKFDPTLGYKAFSYFGTIGKRYLIISNTKNYKKKVDSLPVENIDDDSKFSYDALDSLEQEDKLSIYIDKFVNHCTNNIYSLFPKTQDAKIADAVLEMFRQRDKFDIADINNKKLNIYVKEIIDVRTPKITKISNRLYTIFKKNYIFYLENGYLPF